MIQCTLFWGCVERVGLFQLFLNFARYYPLACLAFLFFYIWRKGAFASFKIQEKTPEMKYFWAEFRQSAVTLVVFTGMSLTYILLAKMKLVPSAIYFDLPDSLSGWLYMPLSFLFITIWHETWFYWMHRLVHWKPIYRYFHQVHHMSVNPTPLAAYRFQATEAFLEGIYAILFNMFVPMYYWLFIFHTFFVMCINIYVHTGFEFFPKGFVSHPLGKWINTSTHHNMHHQKVLGNYSLYLNFWDRVLGTNFKDYESHFERIVAKRANF